MRELGISPEWQESLLQCAADELSAGPVIGIERTIRPKLFGRQIECRVVFAWPGVTRVIYPPTGELLAISRPGQPLRPMTRKNKRNAP